MHSPKMTLETADAIVRWLEPLEDQRVTFTFHGGEPLLAGPEFYRYILPKISSRLAHLSPEFAMPPALRICLPSLRCRQISG